MIRRPGSRQAPAARPTRPSALRPGARPGGGVRRTRSVRRASAGLTPVRAGALLAVLAGAAAVYGLASSDAFTARRTTVTGATWTSEERDPRGARDPGRHQRLHHPDGRPGAAPGADPGAQRGHGLGRPARRGAGGGRRAPGAAGLADRLAPVPRRRRGPPVRGARRRRSRGDRRPAGGERRAPGLDGARRRLDAGPGDPGRRPPARLAPAGRRRQRRPQPRPAPGRPERLHDAHPAGVVDGDLRLLHADAADDGPDPGPGQAPAQPPRRPRGHRAAGDPGRRPQRDLRAQGDARADDSAQARARHPSRRRRPSPPRRPGRPRPRRRRRARPRDDPGARPPDRRRPAIVW